MRDGPRLNHHMSAFSTKTQHQSTTKNLAVCEGRCFTASSAQMTLASCSATSSDFEKTVLKLLTEQSLKIDELRKKVDHNASLLDDLCKKLCTKDVTLHGEEIVSTNLEVELPITTAENLQVVETKLEDADFANRLVLKLAVFCGKDIPSTTKSIMSALFAPELARQYNWTGAKGKKVFHSLKINAVVLRAVRKNSKTKDATKDDVKGAIISYLYNARDLNGGRTKRRAKLTLKHLFEEQQLNDSFPIKIEFD